MTTKLAKKFDRKVAIFNTKLLLWQRFIKLYINLRTKFLILHEHCTNLIIILYFSVFIQISYLQYNF